ncbi:TrbG/VirB9 family P-type conjugative transfer protein [Sphingomonas sp. GCM10030256]|uniref:TrbG/VirB9 family P-type conjugative transfer protein n=1 Tax=Sphingomonas sp. GCM10030256 TaxID=3273427 RepID=UPI00360F94AE
MLRLALLAALTAFTQVAPLPPPADPRVQLVPYDPQQVVPIGVAVGFASMVELGEDERIENIIVGNSAVWQITANRQGDRVVIKPLPEAIPTNMIILTGSRRYLFMLYPGGEQSAFVTRFSYPEATEQQPDEVVVSHYRFRGDKALFPVAMYNEGQNTVVTWSKQTALPAVFAVQKGSQEQLVNGRMVGDNFIIEGIAPRYKFRRGDAEATATRRVPRHGR